MDIRSGCKDNDYSIFCKQFLEHVSAWTFPLKIESCFPLGIAIRSNGYRL